MNRRTAGLFLAVVLLLALGIVVLWWSQQDRSATSGQVPASETPELDAAEVVADLYFPGKDGRLFVEQRALPVAAALEERLTSLLEIFLMGPEGDDLYPAFPPEVSLGSLIVTDEGIAFVDLTITGQNTHLPWGSKQEMLAVY